MFDAITKLILLKDKFERLFLLVKVECPTSTEVEFLEEYVKAMQPVAYALDKLQGEKTFYFGYFAPVIFQTRKRLESLILEKTRFSSKIAAVLKKSIETRFKNICELNLQKCAPELFSAISFPFIKYTWVPEETRERLKKAFIDEAKQIRSTILGVATSTIGTKVPSTDDKFFKFEEPDPNSQVISNDVELECIKYFQDPSVELGCLDCYPSIRKVFEKYNTALASSAPVERAFSYGGLLLTPKRATLSDEMIDKLVVLKVSYGKSN